MDSWDLSEPRIKTGKRPSREGAPFTDVHEGKDELNFDEQSLKNKLERLLEQINGGDNFTNDTLINTPGNKSVIERLTELEDRIGNMSAECNADGTITITI